MPSIQNMGEAIELDPGQGSTTHHLVICRRAQLPTGPKGRVLAGVIGSWGFTHGRSTLMTRRIPGDGHYNLGLVGTAE